MSDHRDDDERTSVAVWLENECGGTQAYASIVYRAIQAVLLRNGFSLGTVGELGNPLTILPIDDAPTCELHF